MENKNLIGGAVILVIIIVAVVVFSGNDKGLGGNNIFNKGGNSGTLKDFMSGVMGTNISCDFGQKIGLDNELKVKTYIAGEKVRVDYKMKKPIEEGLSEWQDMYIISDGEYTYIWGDSPLGGVMQGMKIKQEDFQEEGENENVPVGMIDYETPLSNCNKWSVDNKMFEIPNDIQFFDPTNMMDMMFQGMGIPEEMEVSEEGSMGEGIDCSVCDQLPVGQKESCLQAMGC